MPAYTLDEEYLIFIVGRCHVPYPTGGVLMCSQRGLYVGQRVEPSEGLGKSSEVFCFVSSGGRCCRSWGVQPRSSPSSGIHTPRGDFSGSFSGSPTLEYVGTPLHDLENQMTKEE